MIGYTGSGKSVTANVIAMCLLVDPAVKALIIDKGGSFKK